MGTGDINTAGTITASNLEYTANKDQPNGYVGLDANKLLKTTRVIETLPKTNIVRNIAVQTVGTFKNVKLFISGKRLTIPTYESSGQAVHPSVVYVPQGWGVDNKKYWMVMTPLPNNNSAYENPSIICSDDGETWTVPTGLTNPIQLPTGSDFLADGHLFLDDDGTMYCYYKLQGTNHIEIMCKSSTDGVIWSDPVQILGFTGTTSNNFFAPIMVKVNGEYWLYTASGSSNYVLQRRISTTSPISGFGEPENTVFTGQYATSYWWHGDIKLCGDKFVALASFNDTGYGYTYYFGVSSDGLNFTFEKPYSVVTLNKDSLFQNCGDSWLSSPYMPSLIWMPEDRMFDVFLSTVGNTAGSRKVAIGRGKLLLLPNDRFNLLPITQMFSILGDVRGFWPFIKGWGSYFQDYGRKGNLIYSNKKTILTSVTCTLNSKTITGTGFSTSVAVGDILSVGGEEQSYYVVEAIPDDSTITLSEVWNSANGTYNLIVMQGIQDAFDNNPELRFPVHIIQLNGTDEYFEGLDSDDFSFGNVTADLPFSVGAFIHLENTGDEKTVISKWDSGSSKREWKFIFGSDEKVIFQLNDESGGATAYRQKIANAATSLSIPHFVVVTYNGVGGDLAADGVHIYVDGVEVASTSVKGAGVYTAMQNTASPIMIGVERVNGAVYGTYKGKIGLPFVTAKQFTADEVYALYQIVKQIMRV
jgi:hypothetical protein